MLIIISPLLPKKLTQVLYYQSFSYLYGTEQAFSTISIQGHSEWKLKYLKIVKYPTSYIKGTIFQQLTPKNGVVVRAQDIKLKVLSLSLNSKII